MKFGGGELKRLVLSVIVLTAYQGSRSEKAWAKLLGIPRRIASTWSSRAH